MKKTTLLSVLVVAVKLIIGVVAEAQQPTKIPRIGFLSSLSPAAVAARMDVFRQGLRELGYVEGQNIIIEYRYAEGKLDRLPDLAAELVRLKVDVIVTGGPAVNRSAKEATVTIPIVMALDNDPVGNGYVASLARPGGNITGLSTLAPEISGKQMELLKEIVPKLSRVAVFGNSGQPGNPQALRETELAAAAFKAQLQYLDVRHPKDIETAFREASKARAGAVLVLGNVVVTSHPKRFVELAAKSRIPLVGDWGSWAADGALLSYGPNIGEMIRRVAVHVDKILKGTKPTDIPVERPTKFELIINLNAAKAIGLTVPPNVLVRADKVIQ